MDGVQRNRDIFVLTVLMKIRFVTYSLFIFVSFLRAHAMKGRKANKKEEQWA